MRSAVCKIFSLKGKYYRTIRNALKLIHHLSLSLIIILIPRVDTQRLRLLTQRLLLTQVNMRLIPSRFRSDIHPQRLMIRLYHKLIPSRSGSHFNARQLKRSLVLSITLALWHVSLLATGSVAYLLLVLTRCGTSIHTFLFSSHQTQQH